MNHIQWLDASRAEFNGLTTEQEFHQLAKDARVRVLQCSSPVPERVWIAINEHLLSKRPDLELRVYGHYGIECDLSFVHWIPDVRHFSADCLLHASSVDCVKSLTNLESLSLGIFHLANFDVLDALPTTLTSLRLQATKSKKLSLIGLERFPSLKTLSIEGHHKGLEVLGDLVELEILRLRSVTTPNLQLLTKLHKLSSLTIELGGINSFSGLEGKECLKHLELWQIRDLRRIDFLSSLTGMQNLSLQSLPHIEAFPALERLISLRRICIENLKGLQDFSELERAPALAEFLLVEGRKQSPRQLIPVLSNPRLKRIAAGFATDRKNQEFLDLRDKFGKDGIEFLPPFEYS